MKKIVSVLSIMVLSIGIYSCKKENGGSNTTTTTSTTGTTYESGMTFNTMGTLTLAFNHTFGLQALELAPKSYITQANDTVKVTQLTYYVSNVTLTSANGAKINLGNYDLVGYLAGQPSTILLDSIPAGRYTSISYLIGVDSLANSTGVHSGALDPSNGLYWTWSTGYVFIRLKGRFSSQNTAYSFDIGGDGNTMNISHNLASYNAGGTLLTASVNVDLAKVFNTPNVYDLKVDAIDIHSSGEPSIPKLKANISNAFGITGIQ
ncbi:MAG: MbnP family protein [Bacteroidota bacterium]